MNKRAYLLNVKDVMERCRLKESTAYELMHKLGAFRINRCVRLRETTLLRYIARGGDGWANNQETGFISEEKSIISGSTSSTNEGDENRNEGPPDSEREAAPKLQLVKSSYVMLLRKPIATRPRRLKKS